MSAIRRRRTQSSSRAEEIVTAELRARRAQPDRPVHRAADSLLSWASAAPLHTRGLVNWAGLLLALSGARLVLENLLTYGLRVSAAGWASFLLGAAGQPHHYPVLYLLAALHLPLLATLHLERLLSSGRLAASTATGLHCAILVLVFALPVVLINLPALKFGLVSAVLACGGYCVIGLKLVSYIQVRARDQRESAWSSENGSMKAFEKCLIDDPPGELVVPQPAGRPAAQGEVLRDAGGASARRRGQGGRGGGQGGGGPRHLP